MSRFFMLIIGLIIVLVKVNAQSFTLTGKVTDKHNEVLPGTSVLLKPIGKIAVSNANGIYVVEGVEMGSYFLEASFVGYETHSDSLLIDSDMWYDINLQTSVMNLQEVVVSDHYAENRKKEESLNIEVVNTEFLRQNLGGSLVKSLERLPGVATIAIGSGQSKPLIRGLGFNRVVVVENGIKHEGQQWGEDHGLEIDQFAVNKVEVLKGPSSLIYGSDAIGGVINLKQNSVPTNHLIEGSVDLLGRSVNDQLGSSIAISGRKDRFFGSLRATVINYGDYKVPTSTVDVYSLKVDLDNNHLRNTAGDEQNVHAMLGFRNDRLDSRLFISHFNQKSGFFANAHGLEPVNVDEEKYDRSSRDIQFPYHTVKHLKMLNRNRFEYGKVKLEADFGFQRNYRQEHSQYVSHGYMPAVFPGGFGFEAELEREFEKYIYSGNIRSSYELAKKATMLVGVSAEHQDNQINGRGFIIPEFNQFSFGSFVLLKYKLSLQSLLQFGVRYDFGNIQTESYFDWFESPHEDDDGTEFLQRAWELDRNFSNVSWSAGYNYNSEQLSLKVNIGKSFRMPIAKELAANGVNYHRFSFEVGDSELSPEVAYQLDAGLEYKHLDFAIGITPFLNYFSNYIFLNPTSEHDRLYGNGNQIFRYKESEVMRFGGELHAHVQLAKNIQFGAIGEYVYSEQTTGEKEGFTLPFSPPASLLFNLRYDREKFGFINHAYASLDFKLTAAQNRVTPPENPTDGYHLFNFRFGGKLILNQQVVDVSIQVQNLLNAKYFNHTSYYRLINVPEPGRSIVIHVSIPFKIKSI